MIPFNYHHLYYFYVIARSGTMMGASEQLLLNQSTLSLQLKQFEKSIRCQLFERRQQRLVLTPKGKQILHYAKQIFEIGNQLEDVLKGSEVSHRRVIEVGVLNGTPRAFGHALLRSLRTYDPSAQLVLREGGLERLLKEMREFHLDALLTDVSIRSQDKEEFENHLIGKVPIVLAAAPKLSKRFRSLPKDLEGAPFLLPSSPSQVYRQILDLIAEWKIKPHIVAEIQDVELARRMALSGEGIVPLNAYTVSVSLPKGGLNIIGGKKIWGLYESIYIVTRKESASNKMVGFLQKNMNLLGAFH
jgi:LysR family transcriptional activator of nhaA